MDVLYLDLLPACLLLLLAGCPAEGQLPAGVDVCGGHTEEAPICQCTDVQPGQLKVDCGRLGFDEIPTEIPPDTQVL